LRARSRLGHHGLGHHVQRRHPRHRAQELTDIADHGLAQPQDSARLGAREVRGGAAVMDKNLAVIAAVVARRSS